MPESRQSNSGWVVPALFALGLSTGALAIYQWRELAEVRAGKVARCSISETVDCGRVWTSAMAIRLHDALGIPVAGLGLIWAAVALVGVALLARGGASGPGSGWKLGAVRLTAAVGALSCVMFATGSIQAGAVCLTCLGTYALVGAFALVALLRLPGPVLPAKADWPRAVGAPGAAALLTYLLLLSGGERVLGAVSEQAGAKLRPSTGAGAALDEYVASLKPEERAAMADALAAFERAARPPGVDRYQTHFQWGPAMSPVKLVEFTDIRCGHCRALLKTLKAIKEAAPMGSFSVEPRYFPLDSECNPGMGRSEGTGVRCAGVRAQICLEGAPDFFELQEKLFDEQETLTVDRVLAIASSGTVTRERLTACMSAPSTAARIAEDLAYATSYNIDGTPLVLLNGKEAPPVGGFLFALVLAGGDPSAPAFRELRSSR